MEKNMEKSADKISTEHLIADFKVVVEDAEALLKETASQGGEKLAEVRAKAEESIRVAKFRMADARAVLLANARDAAAATDAYTRENPWKAVGVAAGLALVVGLLIGRR